MTAYELDRLSDEEIRSEIFRLRSELNKLKAIVAERANENSELRTELERTQKAIGAVYQLAEKISGKLDDVDDSFSSLGREYQESLYEANETLSKKLESKYEIIASALERSNSEETLSSITTKISELEEMIDTRLGATGLRAVRRTIERVSIISVVNTIGTIISLGLLFYFVLAII